VNRRGWGVNRKHHPQTHAKYQSYQRKGDNSARPLPVCDTVIRHFLPPAGFDPALFCLCAFSEPIHIPAVERCIGAENIEMNVLPSSLLLLPCFIPPSETITFVTISERGPALEVSRDDWCWDSEGFCC
jgi:hypothetical protein